MTDLLRKNLAPIGDKAWAEIESVARESLKRKLSARKLVDFKGPFGWELASVNLGRVQTGESESVPGVAWGARQTQPLVEIRAPFSMNLWEMDNLERGARCADLDPILSATGRAAQFEEQAVYNGFAKAGIRGVLPEIPHPPIPVRSSPESLVSGLEKGLIELEKAGIGGPFALVAGGDLYERLMSGDQHGHPIRDRVERLFAAGAHWSPAADSGFLLSARGGDYELTVGQDFSIGYQAHDTRSVELYLTESFTFCVLEPRAAIRLEIRK